MAVEGIDLIFAARTACSEADYPQVAEELRRLAISAGLWRSSTNQRKEIS
jgi:hypothetical protein